MKSLLSSSLLFAIPVINGVSGKLVKSLAAELKVATFSSKFHTEKKIFYAVGLTEYGGHCVFLIFAP